jgi:pyridoxine 4-dehydrogenase
MQKTFTFPQTSITVGRMGYGAMQLAGPHVFGPPKDMDAAIAVLRKAIELGVNHIDTSDFYGPHFTNQVIKRALHPYPSGLTIVTKVGAARGTDGSWNLARGKEDLTKAVHDNLRNLGVEALDVVNLRVGQPLSPPDESIAEPFSVLADLKRQGLIRHLGLSTISAKQLAECQKIAPVVCVQNQYNVVDRKDDAFIDELAKQGIAYVPY